MDQDEMKIESMSDNDIDSTFLPFLNGGDDESSSSSDDELPYEPATSYNLDSRSELLQRLPAQQGSKTWNMSNEFFPLPAAPPMEEEDNSIYLVRPIDAFYRYIPEKVISDLALATSQRISLETNSNVVVTTQTMKQFIGANIVMSYIRYPRIRMYWEAKTFIPQIADVMSRKLFAEIRHYLTCRDYSAVTKEEKKINLFWKINPILECVRNACLANPRSKNVSIYKQIVPLRSQAKKILVKGKPNPVTLKNFVLTAQDGLPLDFFLYQGKELTDIYPKLKLDLGEKVALKLSESLPPGCNLYMNNYFTSLTVMEVLFPLGIHCTGILQKQRIPEDCDFGLDSDFRSKGRGSFIQLVRDDGQFSIVKWFDETVIVVGSNVHGALPEDYVAYWKKSRNSYIHVNRPNVVSRYNMNMKGVEILEGMMDRYRISAKSINWTVKTIFHFIDFAILAAWIERKRVNKKKITRDRIELIDFKIEVANSLLHCGSGEICQVNDSREVLASNVGLSNKRRVIPLPSDAVRSSGALHLPEKPVGAKLSRCRLPGCQHSKCRFWCKTCKVFLCLTSTRNCFKKFHEL